MIMPGGLPPHEAAEPAWIVNFAAALILRGDIEAGRSERSVMDWSPERPIGAIINQRSRFWEKPTMSTSGSPRFSLIATGDGVIDHHLHQGERSMPTTDHKPGVRDLPEPGGASESFDSVALGRLLKNVPDWRVPSFGQLC
jgi:hypothetical protein